jgi:transposase
LSRGDLSEAEWRLLKDMLPAERGRKSRPTHDNRTIVNDILWHLWTGGALAGRPRRSGTGDLIAYLQMANASKEMCP